MSETTARRPGWERSRPAAATRPSIDHPVERRERTESGWTSRRGCTPIGLVRVRAHAILEPEVTLVDAGLVRVARPDARGAREPGQVTGRPAPDRLHPR